MGPLNMRLAALPLDPLDSFRLEIEGVAIRYPQTTDSIKDVPAAFAILFTTPMLKESYLHFNNLHQIGMA